MIKSKMCAIQGKIMCRLIVCILTAFLSFQTLADTYYVETNGQDSKERNGKSKENAWASLAFACEQISEGDHTILIGSGTFTVTKTAYLKSGFKIKGSGKDGDNATILTASTKWKMVKDTQKKDPIDEYMIAIHNKQHISVSDLSLRSDAKHRLTGGLRCKGGKKINLFNLDVREFKWAGLNMEHSSNLKVYDNVIHNASTDKSRWWNGLMKTRHCLNTIKA